MASRVAYRIPTRYLGLAALKTWIVRAADGATIDYAWGPGLDQSEPTVRMVSELIAGKQVMPHQKRENGAPVYFLRRTKHVVMPEPVRRVVRSPEHRATPAGQLFLVLEALAERGQPCPSYRELAEKADLRDLQAARYALTKLEAEGRIKIETDGHERIIHIVGTGLRTAAKSR